MSLRALDLGKFIIFRPISRNRDFGLLMQSVSRPKAHEARRLKYRDEIFNGFDKYKLNGK